MKLRLCFMTMILLGLGAAAIGRPAAAAGPPAEVRLVLEDHQFHPAEIRIKAGAPFVLIITNKDSEEEEFECEALRIERGIPPGKTTRVQFRGLRAGVYDFMGEKHVSTKGRIVVE
jgi:plastocyanin